MRMAPCCSEFRLQRRIFACIIILPTQNDYLNGAKSPFDTCCSGLKRIIHGNSRWSTRRGGDGHTEKAKTRAKKIAFPLIDLSPQNERVLA
ncbi:hypothetical protein BDA96_07G239800 [Sorghum bicolor]|uniref:Uncharacterized protein n=2 Tax=Sorghum bicolor TaxID=4558 RepID=A0A921QMI9_SORBI|nr:hypothetical protein BDA96_07G239800 [Sorghum bicolor]KXG25725.1 hypothetical protein SORBI_3007G224600 [Sorghum bicolor]